ncbi:hypothetical protein OESDEN_05781 [Oesophagostomum dentatum]|uniref:Uncharacterized protein n=1 Tax=Oesophagostomum dentatum TaxID=61180 RepID=A0A0B1TAK3_OESDE|nr:hypothetical protein OESDEN_05781 [Oesophagostomum dentatum]
MDQLHTPPSFCSFCSIEDSKDCHPTGRCCRFPDAVSRAIQAASLNLCQKYLRARHPEDCGITYTYCSRDHNVLLCPSKSTHIIPAYKHHKVLAGFTPCGEGCYGFPLHHTALSRSVAVACACSVPQNRLRLPIRTRDGLREDAPLESTSSALPCRMTDVSSNNRRTMWTHAHVHLMVVAPLQRSDRKNG